MLLTDRRNGLRRLREFCDDRADDALQLIRVLGRIGGYGLDTLPAPDQLIRLRICQVHDHLPLSRRGHGHLLSAPWIHRAVIRRAVVWPRPAAPSAILVPPAWVERRAPVCRVELLRRARIIRDEEVGSL